MYLSKNKILEYLKIGRLVIRPLLELSQINSTSIDFRLGCDFLVSIQGREPYIDASFQNGHIGNLNNFFQETRRQLGDTFILHPNQTVLASSLEYIRLPENMMAIIGMRSSYARLGINISSSLEPGYCGCISLELTNTSKNAIRLTVGACMFQARLAFITQPEKYNDRKRKYLCQVRTQISNLYTDKDLEILKKISDKNNNITT